MFIANQIHSIL